MSEASYLCMRRALNHTFISIRRQCRTPTRTQPPRCQKPISRSTRTISSPNPISIANQARCFSNVSSRRATMTLHNPRVDDEGNEMKIEISDRAAHRLQQITTPSAPPRSLDTLPITQYTHLRITVTSGGCHGFQYLMSLEPSTSIEEDDTIFTSSSSSGVNAAATEASPDPAKVVMDEASLELLKGSTVDYTTELIGSQFKIVGNPRAKSSCGCGTSFDIED